MSARENLLVALRTALSGLCDGRVYRSRLDQLPVLPAIIITPESETDTGEMLGCTDATLTVAISIYARADIPDQAIDPILAAVLAALRTDSTLGLGSDVQIQPSRRIDWDIQNYDDGAATLHIDITYRTY
jgi:hypothetical protein